ncbi:hypothetical protein VaNZ11_003531 [Volvox africanus]|uniref:Tyrosine specific protein phosphatases domain-containing protein n=1 Tax=Volvox africanus TaxID=51714 RepID=A0ABQ5RUD6_9CHLO|nr:hypothetical protein VaNZ11_003531 [Volvox africanus]
MQLSYIVFTCATVPTCLALALAWPSRWQLGREPLRCASVLALGYSAAVGYTVALAASSFLACTSTKLMGKCMSGYIHPLSWLFMLPYHLGLRIKLGTQRLVSTEPLYNRVLPGWYIGGWPWSGSELPSDSPSVVDCTCELPRTHHNRYLCLPAWDTQAPTSALIDRGVTFALAERSQGKPVYIHCAHGHGRSALLLIACLLEAGHVGSWEEGLALLKAVRPRVHLNRRQRQALEAWARSRGKGGLQMQSLSTTAAAAAGTASASSLAVMTGGPGVSSAWQRRGSTGGSEGGGDPDGGARVHLLADTRDTVPKPGSALPLPYSGLESRLAGLPVTTSNVTSHHGAVNSIPRAEPLRQGVMTAVMAAAAASTAAAATEGGKKMS